MESAESDSQYPQEGFAGDARSRWRKKRWAIPSMLLAILLAALIAAWFSRYSIADNIIQDQLDAYDLPGTYDIERIGGRTQVITNLVIGDPAAPDLTAERVVVRLRYKIGLPEIASVKLVEPRLFGSYRNGTLSFGSLDRAIFRESDGPPGLPELNLDLRDGRALLETDWGPVGIKAEGRGLLSDGFDGMVAATAPELAFGDCAAQGASAYGKVTTAAGEPRFAGPVRLTSLGCESSGFAANDYALAVDASLDRELSAPRIEARVDGGRTSYGEYAVAGLTGTIRSSMPGDIATARFSLAGRGFASPQALAAVLTLEGQARAQSAFDRIDVESQIEGNGLRLGPQLVTSLNSLSTTGEGTLLAPITRKIAFALQSETRGSALQADLRLRRSSDRISLLVPTGDLRGGSGARILSVSRFAYATDGEGAPTLSGNIATGGAGLPRITGRMEREGNSSSAFRLSMERYEADGAALSVPKMAVFQTADGALRFAGAIEASGPLPGGATSNLRVPIDGSWRPNGTLAVWGGCTDVSFDRLELASLRFDNRNLTLCPPKGRSILSSGPGGLRVAAGTPALDLQGYLGETPIRLATGPVGFAYPGVMTARAIDVSLGPVETASRFRITDLDAKLGPNIEGSFSDAEVALASIPLDIRNAGGRWDYTQGKLTIADGAFRLLDREEPDRFEPLVASDGVLTLVDNTIRAAASLRHPASGRLVTEVDILHDLARGAGHADLTVPGLVFDDALQPDELSTLALGVIANANGTVTGKGRIDWFADGSVSSSGTFGTEKLDFAAAFGPVQGASGTIEFTDLLNLTTAPNQKLRVASVNPGIEVIDGEIEFELRNGTLLAVAGGSWPFMGGRLILRNVDFNFGVSEERRYIFEIVGLEAAQFVAQMELENLSATGVFDGTVPIVFDANGNGRIDTGVLISRSPGGNISYVGELTYEDLSPIANFAFDALKSLDYDQMRVIMEGPLTGEIVTRVRFDGVSQGEGAKSNFVTKRLAALPLQFRINIRAQFYQLLTSLKSMYDPAAVRDPRELGLLSDDGKRLLRPSITGEEAEPEINPGDLIPDEPTIQQQESE
ncbi:YdbH domain-containing protein [Qipengyuania sp. 6B39]|uniref:intermembrane phospholipid transport protein YdbH family protein n=1 Tax=Qipengyuania proteolytica TaxID=2867239 RepID=UPI001C89CE41|nr:YdbH domain-containing protein [Qipengyuania proteolytica]MBX7496375.1 YdbH domain-containing protein [Qipengyuania proteolytica]